VNPVNPHRQKWERNEVKQYLTGFFTSSAVFNANKREEKGNLITMKKYEAACGRKYPVF
jgi:hypothetical protein